jgi:hypothetical protein
LPGAKVRTRLSPRTLPLCVCAQPRVVAIGPNRNRWNGSSLNGRMEKLSRRHIGSRPCPRTRLCRISSTKPNCAGASNVITRSCKANSDCPLRRSRLARFSPPRDTLHRSITASLSASGKRFSPQPRGSGKCLRYTKVSDPAAPPIRPQRHVENSIATIRKQLAVALAKTLRDVHVVIQCTVRQLSISVHDTVELAGTAFCQTY